ncbi:MAG: 3-phosphoshikimate 1-carboxyvinyltransferase [Clostridia bacterium]|nr:3-phosphoshikimate 1-carboxyvinyltransferase [Clostridia bacterium]
MNVTLNGARISGTIKAIPSKSYAHRILICNFLAGNTLNTGCDGFTSKDIEATKRCLEALSNGENTLDCGESGSTLRFLIPLVSAIGGKYCLIGHGRLIKRPNDELFNVLKAHGVTATQDGQVEVCGKLTSGEYKLRGDISSQYVTGLIMALSILDGDSTIVLTTPLASAPYVDITIEVLKNFGVVVEKNKDVFKIKGNQKYCGDAKAEGDWSNMAFFMVLGAVAGEVTVNGMNFNSVQGDKKILQVLLDAGARLTVSENSVTVKKGELNCFTLDAENCPDLVPIASVIAAFSKGTTVIKNVERLKIKESDRIETTIKMLKAFGINAESDGHDLTIYGGQVKGGEISSFNDHRIVMSSAVLSAGADGRSKIIDAEAVNKSYPTFFEDYTSVGGIVSEV